MKTMKKFVMMCIASFALLTAGAHASLVNWNWQASSLSGEVMEINAFGTFTTADDAVSAPTQILSIDGFWNGVSITGVESLANSGQVLSFNNLIYGASLPPVSDGTFPFDYWGLMFRVGDEDTGDIDLVNFYSDSGELFAIFNHGTGVDQNAIFTKISFTAGHEQIVTPPVAEVPEPATWALVPIGIFGVVFFRRQKYEKTAILMKSS